LGRDSPDLDVVVADDAEELAKQLAATLRTPWFSLSERYPTYRVLKSEGHVDLASVRGADILTDLAERDFTINAMAVPVTVAAGGVGDDAGSAGLLDDTHILDPFNGAVHLREKRLVEVSDRIFTDDPLRLMRAARFCHTLGLDLEAGLLRMIQEQAADLTGAAAERVVNEMCITLGAGRSADAVRLWGGLGLLKVVLPELADTEDAWEAKLSLLSHLDESLEHPEEWFTEDTDQLRQRMAEPVDGAVSKPVALRLAGLMQGIDDAEVHAISLRLKLSGALDSLLVAAARCLGGKPGSAVSAGSVPGFRGMLAGEVAVSRETVLFMWNAAPWEPEVVMLASALGAAETGRDTLDEAARRLMSLAVRRTRGELPAVPVDGEMLMFELGLESGPVLGRALREARLAWESGEATDRAEVIEAARSAVGG